VGFQPCQYYALIGLSKPPALPVVMTAPRVWRIAQKVRRKIVQYDDFLQMEAK